MFFFFSAVRYRPQIDQAQCGSSNELPAAQSVAAAWYGGVITATGAVPAGRFDRGGRMTRVSLALKHAGLPPVCYALIDEVGNNNGFNIIALDGGWTLLPCVMPPLS